jgi:uncharacterized membrane protein YfcA
VLPYLVLFLAGILGGILNTIAGGGTLITFPALLWVGGNAVVANATNAVAMWPGSLAGAYGFRREISTARRWIYILIAPSLLGAAFGSWLLLRTPVSTFERIVPFLILGATVLLAAQELMTRWLRLSERENAGRGWTVFVVVFQCLVGVYGGYFGAGMGILMLAALGLIGLTDLHQMNGVKNVLGVGINGIAAIYFAISHAVDWHDVLVLMAGTIAGGILGARLAHRLGRTFVRRAVVVIGLVMTVVLFVK